MRNWQPPAVADRNTYRKHRDRMNMLTAMTLRQTAIAVCNEQCATAYYQAGGHTATLFKQTSSKPSPGDCVHCSGCGLILVMPPACRLHDQPCPPYQVECDYPTAAFLTAHNVEHDAGWQRAQELALRGERDQTLLAVAALAAQAAARRVRPEDLLGPE